MNKNEAGFPEPNTGFIGRSTCDGYAGRGIHESAARTDGYFEEAMVALGKAVILGAENGPILRQGPRSMRLLPREVQ